MVFYFVLYQVKGGCGTQKNVVEGDDKIFILFAITNYKCDFANNI